MMAPVHSQVTTPVTSVVFGAFIGFLGSHPWFVVAGVTIAVVGVGWGVRDAWRARRMRDEYHELARRHDWTYVPLSRSYNQRFRTFPFGTGMSPRQESVLTGTFSGVECATFAQVYEDGLSADDVKVTRAYQVTVAELPVVLPRIDIVPRGFSPAALRALGGQEIHVESHEFNQRWRVVCRDPRYAHAVIDPRMMERLLWSDVQGMAVRIEGGAVLEWAAGRQGAADAARRFGAVVGIARRIPDHVVREYIERGHGVGHDAGPLRGPDWATTPGALVSRRYTGIGAEAGPGPHSPAGRQSGVSDAPGLRTPEHTAGTVLPAGPFRAVEAGGTFGLSDPLDARWDGSSSLDRDR